MLCELLEGFFTTIVRSIPETKLRAVPDRVVRSMVTEDQTV